VQVDYSIIVKVKEISLKPHKNYLYLIAIPAINLIIINNLVILIIIIQIIIKIVIFITINYKIIKIINIINIIKIIKRKIV